MKKFLAYFIVAVFSVNLFGTGISYATVGGVTNSSSVAQNADKMQNIRDLYFAKSVLENNYKGRKYLKQIDSFIEKNSKNKKLLTKLTSKLDKAQKKEINDKITKNVIKYINSKSKLALIELKKEEKDLFFTETISENDKKFIEEKIVNIQLNLLDDSKDFLENLSKEFEKLTNYEESGNLEIDTKLNHEEIGKFEGNLKVNNYSSKASTFDSQFTGEIEALLNAIPKGEEEMKLQIKSMIDLISKDGNIYVLLKDFKLLEEKNINEFKDFVEKIKEISEKNEYIKYSDEDTKAGLELIKSINPDKILNDSKEFLNKSLITAYKKDGDKYYLKPTKYACDKLKELGNKFDPFNPKTCTQGQYEDLLDSINENGKFYAVVKNNKIQRIHFVGDESLGFFTNTGSISFESNSIKEFRYGLEDAKNFLFIDYIKNNKADFVLKNKEKNSDVIRFYSKLDSNNKFNEIDFDVNMEDSFSSVKGSVNLNNRIINGDINIDQKSYNWETKEYKPSFSVKLDINGSKDYSNNLETLNIEITGTDTETKKEEFKGKFNLNNNSVTISGNFENEGEKGEFEISGKIDSSRTLTDGKIKLLVLSKEGKFDQDTFKFVYDGDFEKTLDINIEINNKNISGKTIIFKEFKEIVNITHTGNYSEDKFKLDNNIKLDSSFDNMFLGNSIDVRDSKRYSDIATIARTISIKSFSDKSLNLNDFVLEDKELYKEKVIINGEELNNGKDYIIGNINFNNLGLNKEDFFNPNNGPDYIVAVSTINKSFQVFGILENGDARIVGNFVQMNPNDSESLINYNGKFLENGDKTGFKYDSKESDKKDIEANYNFDIDLSNNKNNINVLFNFMVGNEEIFYFNIKNIGKKEYKDIEIEEPSSSIDFKEILK